MTRILKIVALLAALSGLAACAVVPAPVGYVGPGPGIGVGVAVVPPPAYVTPYYRPAPYYRPPPYYRPAPYYYRGGGHGYGRW
jgi:hypothetical protein